MKNEPDDTLLPGNDPVAKLMGLGLTEMPFGDFDQRMLSRIRKESRSIEKSKKDRNLSALFFLLGGFFGLCLAVLFGFGQGEQSHASGSAFVFKGIAIALFLLLGTEVLKRARRAKAGNNANFE